MASFVIYSRTGPFLFLEAECLSQKNAKKFVVRACARAHFVAKCGNIGIGIIQKITVIHSGKARRSKP